MNHQAESNTPSEFKQKLVEFAKHSSGLEALETESLSIILRQRIDSKWIRVNTEDILNVIQRSDTEGVDFLQINLKDNKKILITATLIGFKPAQLPELDSSRIPKVVTTQDLTSVFDAIEEALYLSENPDEEIQLLKRIFDSVIAGGENVGFDLAKEKLWVQRLPLKFLNLSA